MYDCDLDVHLQYFLHTIFFCMLTPIIIPLYALQILLFYWACKIRMLKLCKFPKMIRRWLMGIVFANLLVSLFSLRLNVSQVSMPTANTLLF